MSTDAGRPGFASADPSRPNRAASSGPSRADSSPAKSARSASAAASGPGWGAPA
jgi:hypothetical protein